MTEYRIYVLNRQDKVAESLEERFEDDRAAVRSAETLAGGAYAAEVWSGERLVARLGGVLRLLSL